MILQAVYGNCLFIINDLKPFDVLFVLVDLLDQARVNYFEILLFLLKNLNKCSWLVVAVHS